MDTPLRMAGGIPVVPVIIAWKDDRSHRFGPEIPGGSEDRWHDCGERYGGRLELSVGDDYRFIFTEGSDFTEPDLNLTSISGVPDAENEGHTSNAGFAVTDGGVVVFDAPGTPAPGYRLLQRIREVTDQPVERVVISRYHADHICGLQAFKDHAGIPPVRAQALALGYAGGAAASQGEDAQRRLAQRREALFPRVDEHTRIVPPEHTFAGAMRFTVGDVTFVLRHLDRRMRRVTAFCCWIATTCCSSAT